MDNTHPHTLIGNQFPELVNPDNNFKPKLKARAVFFRNILVFFPSLCLNHYEVRIYNLMEEFIEKVDIIPMVQYLKLLTGRGIYFNI